MVWNTRLFGVRRSLQGYFDSGVVAGVVDVVHLDDCPAAEAQGRFGHAACGRDCSRRSASSCSSRWARSTCGSVLRSPAGATFGPVLGLMVFAYVTGYLVLFAAAWAATASTDPRAEPVARSGTGDHRAAGSARRGAQCTSDADRHGGGSRWRADVFPTDPLVALTPVTPRHNGRDPVNRGPAQRGWRHILPAGAHPFEAKGPRRCR